MSNSWKGGSTRRWRKIGAAILLQIRLVFQHRRGPFDVAGVLGALTAP